MTDTPLELPRIMLDLETLSTKPNAAILAIGACTFDSVQILSTFYRNVDLDSCAAHGLDIDGGTFYWWMKQSREARDALQDDLYPLRRALAEFSEWCPRGCEVWGNGASFDNVILRNAYEAVQAEPPWSWWNDRCYRTMRKLVPIVEREPDGVKHNAVHDATNQARNAIHMLRKLGIR